MMTSRFTKTLGAVLALCALSFAPAHAFQYDGDGNNGGNNGGDGNNSGGDGRSAGGGSGSSSGPAGPSAPLAGRPGACTCAPAPAGAATGGPRGVASTGAMPSGPTTASPSTARRPQAVASTTTAVRRGPATRDLMKVKWDFPVQRVQRGDATAVAQSRTLERADAVRALAGDDPRPLLVVRECPSCNKTDRTLLTPGVDNERTILLSRFFHCVKLPLNAHEQGSPYAALFQGGEPAHLLVVEHDGSATSLQNEGSRTELWSAMERALAGAYQGDVNATVREMSKQVDLVDTYDRQIQELERRRDGLVEGESRPNAGKLRRLEEDALRLRRNMQNSIAAIDRLARLGLRGGDKLAAARGE